MGILGYQYEIIVSVFAHTQYGVIVINSNAQICPATDQTDFIASSMPRWWNKEKGRSAMGKLGDLVKEYTEFGCARCYLGIQKMPAGYALMLDADRMYFYWLKEDGTEGVICWNKWWVYHGAKKHKEESEGGE